MADKVLSQTKQTELEEEFEKLEVGRIGLGKHEEFHKLLHPRGASHGLELLKKIFKEAILHKGFSLVDVLQVCVTYFNMYEYYDKHVYELKGHDPRDYAQALIKIKEWDYNKEAPIALGALYRRQMPSFEENFLKKEAAADRNPKIKKSLEGTI